jgi:hypothetical protein
MIGDYERSRTASHMMVIQSFVAAVSKAIVGCPYGSHAETEGAGKDGIRYASRMPSLFVQPQILWPQFYPQPQT